VRRPAENLRLLEALPDALRVTETACL